jgi:hypothetical protein
VDKGRREYKQDWRNLGEIYMAVKLDDKQIVSFEELLMSQVVQQEAVTKLLVEKGILLMVLGVGKVVGDANFLQY